VYGFIKKYDKSTGQGWIDSAGLNEDTIPFLVVPGTDYKIGQRVRFNIGTRAIQIEEDRSELGTRIG
jgi:hypothetical protein